MKKEKTSKTKMTLEEIYELLIKINGIEPYIDEIKIIQVKRAYGALFPRLTPNDMRQKVSQLLQALRP